MKKAVFVLLAFLATGFVKAQSPTPDVDKSFAFTNIPYNFGKIPYGKPTEYEVTIKNLTKDTAVLDNVTAGCGCTTPKFEKGKKIAPGQTIKITLGFNGSVMGSFTRSITIYLNLKGVALTKPATFQGETYTVPETPAPANKAVEKLKPAGGK